MDKNLITSYVDGESTNRNTQLQEARAYNQSLGDSYGYVNMVSPTDIAYAYNQAPRVNYNNQSIGEIAKDAWHTYLNAKNESDIQAADDIINSSNLNMEDAEFLMDVQDASNGNKTWEEIYHKYGITDEKQIANEYQARLERLRMDGVYNEKRDPSREELADIYNTSWENRENAIISREEDMQDLQNSKDAWDISQYATKKANETGYTWGNFLYKTAQQFGSSHSSIDYQTLSMLTGAVVGTALSAVATAAAPVTAGASAPLAGAMWTGTSALWAGLGASIVSQFGGGIQARQEESHIEAYDSYKNNVDSQMEKMGIDKQVIIGKAREKLASNPELAQNLRLNPERLSQLDDDQVFQLVLNGSVDVNDNAFEQARRVGYRGTRELYEKNMSLQAQDMLTDMLFYVPGFRQSALVRSVINPAEAPIAAINYARKNNTFKSFLTKRQRLNAEIAREALPEGAESSLRKLTGKNISKYITKEDLKAIAGAQFANMVEEGSEEGAQYIWQDQASKGEFGKRRASSGLIDAITNGNLIEDIADSWATRARSTLAMFTPFDPVYSNDSQLKENYLAGSLLSITDPTALFFTIRDVARVVTGYKKNQRFGELFERALQEQDYVDRSVDLLQSMRQLDKSGRHYSQVLDAVEKMMKSGKYDLGAISDSSQPVDEQAIDEFMREERDNFAHLLSSKTTFGKKAQELGMTEYDQDVYTAIANNLVLKSKESSDRVKQTNKALADYNNSDKSDAFDEQFNDAFNKFIENNGLENLYTEAELDDLAKDYRGIAMINAALDAAINYSQRLGNQTEAFAILKEQGITGIENAVTLKRLQDEASKAISNLMNEKVKALDNLSKKLKQYNQVQIAEGQISQIQEDIKNLEESEPDINEGDVYLDYIDNLKTLEKRLEIAKKEKDKFTNEVQDAVNEASGAAISDPELLNLYQRSVANQIDDAKVKSDLLEFIIGSKNTINHVKKYKQRVLSQAAERDAANQQAANPTQTVQDRTQETNDQLNQQIDQYNSQISELLANAVSVSPSLTRLLQRISRGINVISDPLGRARYLRNTLSKFSKQLQNIPKDEMTTEDKDVYSNLKNLIDQASAVLDEIDKRAADRAFNAKRRKLDVSVSTQQWTAPDGKKFVFLTNDTEHSIDEGVILHAIDVTDDSDIKELQNEIKDTKKKLNKAKKDAQKEGISEDERKSSQEAAKTYAQQLQNLNADLMNNLANRRVEFKLSEQEDYLKQFTFKNNQGVTTTFERRLASIKRNSDEILEGLKQKRDSQQLDQDYIPDELNDEENGTANSTPDWLEENEQERIQKKDKFKAKAYAFTGTRSGVTYANRLLNPYYEAKEWFGTIQVQPWSEVADYDWANEEQTTGNIKWSRPKAYRTFNKLLKACIGKTDQEVFDIFSKAKAGKLSGITKQQYENMVNALPIQTVLFNNRLRTSNDVLRPTRLVMPDITSRNRTNTLSEYEQSLRENLIMNLVRNTEEGETPKISVEKGGISIFYRSFLQNTKDVVNPQNPLLLGEDGHVLTNQEINDKYDTLLAQKGSAGKVRDYANTEGNELIKLLNNLGYKADDLFKSETPVQIEIDGQTYDALSYLLRGIGKYGDGMIKADSLISQYIIPVLGKSNKKLVNRKNVAEAITDVIMDACPEVFQSYDEAGGEALDTQAQVELALSNNYRISLQLKHNGEQLILNQRTKDSITELAEQLEDFIQSSSNRTQFLEELKNAGYTWSKQTGEILAEYFVNRKFNKLVNPSNIINVLTSGKAVPVTNSLIETRKKVVQQDKISNVKALGIVFDPQSGKLYYSRDKYKTHIEKLQESETDESSEELDVSKEEQQIEEKYKGALATLTSGLKAAKGRSAVKDLYGIEYEDVITLYNTNHPDEANLSTKRWSVKVARWYAEYVRDQELNALRNAQNLEESETVEDASLVSFEGKDTEPVVIAYATANGTIMRYDTYSKKLTPMANATGKAGSVYLVLPSFFNSNRNRVPVKLNPQKIDINVARVIARLMHMMASGQIDPDQPISDGMVDGLKVYQGVSVQEFISQLMYYGTEAIQRNPSNENLNRLVYISNGRLFFGNTLDGRGTEVTEQNIEEFAQWISQNKNYRVDKDMLSNDDMSVRGSYDIIDENGEVILSQNEGDNYVANLIQTGKIMTDMDTSENSTIFGGTPQVYMDYNDHFKGMEESSSTKSNKPSAKESKKAKDEVDRLVNAGKNAGKNKTALADFSTDLVEYLSSFEPDNTTVVNINGQEIEFYNTTDKVKRAQEIRDAIMASTDKLEVEIIIDGEVDDSPEAKAVLNKIPRLSTTKSTTKTSQPTSSSITKLSLDDFIDHLDELEDEQDVRDEAIQYYKANKDTLKDSYKTQKAFVDDMMTTYLGGSSTQSPEELFGSLERSNKSEQSNGRPGSGLTPATEKQKEQPNLPPVNLGGTQQAAKQPQGAATPGRTVEQMLAEPQLDTIEYLISLDKSNRFNSAENKDKIKILRSLFLGLYPKEQMTTGLNLLNTVFTESKVGELLKQYLDKKGQLHSAVSRFLKHFVRTESYPDAVNRAKKILGENFEFDTYTNLPLVFDKARHAMVYVYGVCTANGIRLFRDANKNTIKRGVAYHESFHRVSMLLMTPKERQSMYEALYQLRPDLRNASERERQEYLADMFAGWVLKQISNENPLYRFLNKIGDKIRKLIDRLRNGVNGVQGRAKLHNLFTDMYAGKYAYIEATKENKEYFDLAFEQDPLYSSFKYNGVEIADNAQQFDDIYRSILAEIINRSNLITLENGQVNINYDELKKVYESEVEIAQAILNEAIQSGNIDEIMKANNYHQLMQRIVDNWSSWKKYLKQQSRMQFSLEEIDDPNSVDVSEEFDIYDQSVYSSNADGIAKTIQNDDKIVAAYRRNQFKTLDADVRLFLYAIPESGERTEDGLLKYANVYQLWHELCTLCSEAQNIEDMLNILKRAIAANKGTVLGSTLEQFRDIMSSDTTSDYIKNKLFSNIIKYTNEFIIINYRKNDDGSLSASVENSNQEKSSGTTKKLWGGDIKDKFQALRSNDEYFNPKNPTASVSKVKKDWSKNNDGFLCKTGIKNPSELVTEFTRALKSLLGDYITEDNVLNYINSSDTNGTADDIYRKIITPYNAIVNSLLTKAFSLNEKADENLNKAIKEIFNPATKESIYKNNPLLRLSEYMYNNTPGLAKNDTVRIAKGAVAYIIGQYNHITRLLRRLVKRPDYMKMFENNPYTMVYKDRNGRINYYGSKWVYYISKKIYPDLYTLASTVYDSDYNSGNDFMTITSLEDALNKFSFTMSGMHNIPELANKKTYYEISNIPMEAIPFTLAGTESFSLTDSVLNTFRGYIFSEIAAIRRAKQVRKNFVDVVNKALGTKYTYQQLSQLPQEEQERIFKRKDVAPALGKLRVGYHCKAKNKDGLRTINPGGSYNYRTFGIDLTKGSGYETRHFKGLVDKLDITEDMSDSQIYQFVKSQEVTDFVKDMIEWNLRQVLSFMNSKGLINGYDAETSLARQEIQNVMLPEDVVRSNMQLQSLGNTKSGKFNGQDWIKILSYFTVNNMCDVIEFEKLVSGDIAEYGSNMDSVNKRYSAQTSTTSIKMDKGVRNEFSSPQLGEDDLYNSSTYRTLEVNTTFLDSLEKYKTEAKRFLGVDAFNDTFNAEQEDNPLDYRKLLDENGKISAAARKGWLVKQYLDHFKKGRTYGKVKDERELAKQIVANANERLSPYRHVDPTDASTWISPAMNREIKMREGMWTSRDEACHNLLEHYDEIDVMKQVNRAAYYHTLSKLNIAEEELMRNFNDYKSGKLSEAAYAGYILSKTPGFIQGSLKYVFFGAVNEDRDVFHIYDKTSLSPIYKIFCKGHIMEDVYNLMKENKVHLIKLNSSVKVGNLPSFELFDERGEVDTEAFRNAPKQDQPFEHLGRQLNTDPHESLTSTLLTQFMKVAVMNIDKNYKYKVGGVSVNGDKLLPLYKKILDTLTMRGFNKFCQEFGIDPNTYEVNKEKFMDRLQQMAIQQNASPELIDALNIDQEDFVIHPSAIPNINWIQSKLISAMDKTIIKTTIPGKPLFQVASLGFDNITKYKAYSDKTLRSYNEDGYMEVKLSISLFSDVLKQAGLQNASFDEQRRFILDNQEMLMALSYRVPTQGQNSTLPIKIVDVFEQQRGDIIMFPADITTLTGSDFDIDKMFLARYNIEMVNGKPRRVGYDPNNLESNTDQALQNMLLDIYFSVLTSPRHRIDAVTPLDVTTNPLRRIKDEIQEKKNRLRDARGQHAGWWLNPIFQVEQRQKNAGSSLGTGPMALNNVFRFFLQMSELDMSNNSYFKLLGLSIKDGKNYRVFDRDGESILDSTSALINAHVDAVKDNYIGFMNVNTYTFDVVSMLISNGFGNSTYWLLGQQGICDIADAYVEYKTGNIVADEELSIGSRYLQNVMENVYRAKITDKDLLARSFDKASPEEMTEAFMKDNIAKKNTEEWYCQQLRYINTFLYMKQIGEDYRRAINAAQIDTGKYGITANDIINFMQTHDQFVSEYNTSFMNPGDLFDKTFLGQKYDKGVAALFDIFGNVIIDFSSGYVKTINNVSKSLGIYGAYGKEQMKRIGSRIKTALQANFFVALIREQYLNSSKPLYEIVSGANTVVDRYNSVKERAAITGEGKALFDVLRPVRKSTGSPKFFNIDSSVTDDANIKSNVTQAWRELYESDDQILSDYAKDLAIYMFFVSGGADNNIGGLTKTSIYDLVPPTLIANLSVQNMTYNQYIEGQMNELSKGTPVRQDFVETALALNALFDDKFAKTLNREFNTRTVGDRKDLIVVTKGSNLLLNYNTGTFVPFIKKKNNTKNGYDVYKLGNIMFSKYTDKQGVEKTYMNPVYFKVNQIGYRDQRNPAYSVRADGYMQDGVTKSYLYDNSETISDASQIEVKSKTIQAIFDKMVPFGISVDFANIWDKLKGNLSKYNGYGIPYAAFAAIDDADIVLFVNDDMSQVRLLTNYAQFKNKQFRSVDPSVDKLGYNGKVFVIGSATAETVDKLIEKMPKATFLVTDEANNGMDILKQQVESGKVSGKVWSTGVDTSTESSNTESSTSTSVTQNLIDNGEKTIKECE